MYCAGQLQRRPPRQNKHLTLDVLFLTAIVVTGRSPLVVAIPVVSVVAPPVRAAPSPTPPSVVAPTWPTASEVSPSDPETRPCGLAVVEIHPRCRLVGGFSDGEVHSNGEAGYLRPVQSVAGLLCIINQLEIDEGKSS